MGRGLKKKQSKGSFKLKGSAIATVVVIGIIAVFFAGFSFQRSMAEVEQEDQMQKVSLVRVVDGDTIVVNIEGKQQKVRLIGIDAPESVANEASRNIPEGVDASNYLKGLVKSGQTLYLEKDVSDTDEYGRLLRYVWIEEPSDSNNAQEIENKMLEGILVSAGYAQARTWEPDHAHEKALKKLMKEAIAADRGVSYLWDN